MSVWACLVLFSVTVDWSSPQNFQGPWAACQRISLQNAGGAATPVKWGRKIRGGRRQSDTGNVLPDEIVSDVCWKQVAQKYIWVLNSWLILVLNHPFFLPAIRWTISLIVHKSFHVLQHTYAHSTIGGARFFIYERWRVCLGNVNKSHMHTSRYVFSGIER